jgi:hypothetical protein
LGLYGDLYANKEYSIAGDAVLNAVATIRTFDLGKPKSLRVKNSLLSEAIRIYGLQPKVRHDSHDMAELYEAIIGYAFINSVLTFEDILKAIREAGNSLESSETYVCLLKKIISAIRSKRGNKIEVLS